MNVYNDFRGQVMKRLEFLDGATTKKTDRTLYFDGLRWGSLGNDGLGDVAATFAATINARRAVTGGSAYSLFRGGAQSSGVDFDQSYEPINPATTAAAGGSYTVQIGDTLQSVARALWGDASLWYLIAEANNLSGSSALTAGQTLAIPNKVHNLHNTSDTFRPYDPNQALGDLDPAQAPQPKPPKTKGCGTIGTIILVAIAVAVAVVVAPYAIAAISNAGTFLATGTAGTLTAGTAASAGLAATVAGGAVAGAAGSIVSQGVGVATGLQDRFSWKAVGLAAIAGGVGGAVARIPGLGGSGWVSAAARGAVGSTITQGIGVATGLQDRPDWTGVAVAGIIGGVGDKVGGWAAGHGLNDLQTWAVAGLAGGVVGAGARSLITGTDFGDNLRAVLPDVVGQTIGNAIAGGIQQRAAERDLRRAGVQQSADKFEDQFGDTPEVAAYRKAGLAAANHPGSSDARANFNQAARTLLGANSSDPEVAAFLSHTNPVVPGAQADDIVVTADRDYLFGSTIDNAGIWVGERGNELKQGVGQFIQKNPGIGIALTLADGAFAVVAPAKYLGGMVLDAFKDEAAGYIADKMEGPRLWAPEKAEAGGSGFVLAGGIALGGLGALKSGLGAARTVIPKGFANLDDFTRFGSNLQTGLSKAGYGDAQAILQGSAVTGKSFKTGAPFDAGRVSDFDVAISGRSLLDAAKDAGIGLRSNGTRTGPLTARDLKVLGLRDLSLQMSQQAGRPVNFMIFNSAETAAKRAPSIMLPK